MENKEKNTKIFDDAAVKRLMKIMNVEQETDKFEKWLSNENKLSKNIKKEKTLSFSDATIEKLMEIVDIERIDNAGKFDEWFTYNYKLLEEESKFFKELIKKNKLFLTYYNEQTLTVKFIGWILNKVNFSNKYVKDWYGYKTGCKLNGYILSGEPDFFVATGISIPKTPYFFLQEYKRSVNPKGNPEFQVLAAMLTAMTLNKNNIIRGGYIIGELWKFVILEKTENGNYKYFVSDGFDCLKFTDLKQIYINLQAVKFLYCE